MALPRGGGGVSRAAGERRKVKGEKGKAYKVWIGFIVNAAFARGDADLEGERSIPDALLEDCGGCHSFAGAPRLGMMGLGCDETLAQKHCCRVVVDRYHPCSGAEDGEEIILDNESLYPVINRM